MINSLPRTKARCIVATNRISHRWRAERRRATGDHGQTGQALVEFALASIIFFTIIFGTLDFGRVIYQYSLLHNAVREGARYAKVDPSNTGEIIDRVVHADGGEDRDAIGTDPWPGLNSATLTATVSGGSELGDTVTVSASYQFDLITGAFLGITVPAYTLSASVVVE